MPFTGKATFSAGPTLPEIAEDVADIVAILSPTETPLLNLLGDPGRAARSTVHEWLEDQTILRRSNVATPPTPADNGNSFTVEDPDLFLPGDQIRFDGSAEILLVTAVNVATSTLTVVRGYGGSVKAAILADAGFEALSNAALEGSDAAPARFTLRARVANYTQIFSATVEISGSEQAVRQIAVDDELDYQKTLRLRELLRDLENTVINGRAPAANPQGNADTRRTLRGVLASIATNRFVCGAGGTPGFTGVTNLDEPALNLAIRRIWEHGGARVDTIVVSGAQKRRINAFIPTTARTYSPTEAAFRDRVAIYESDYGLCDVVLSRHAPHNSVLLIDRSRMAVMPLVGRSFHYSPLATTGDRVHGQILGEYTLELRNEAAHGVITGLAA